MRTTGVGGSLLKRSLMSSPRFLRDLGALICHENSDIKVT